MRRTLWTTSPFVLLYSVSDALPQSKVLPLISTHPSIQHLPTQTPHHCYISDESSYCVWEFGPTDSLKEVPSPTMIVTSLVGRAVETPATFNSEFTMGWPITTETITGEATVAQTSGFTSHKQLWEISTDMVGRSEPVATRSLSSSTSRTSETSSRSSTSEGNEKLPPPPLTASPSTNLIPSQISPTVTVNTDTALAQPDMFPSEWVGGACPHRNNTITRTQNGKLFRLECGVDHYGGDKGPPFFVSNFGLCLELCASTPECKTVAYRPQGMDMAPCYIKKELTPGRKDPTIIGGALIDPSGVVSLKSSAASETSGLSGAPLRVSKTLPLSLPSSRVLSTSLTIGDSSLFDTTSHIASHTVSTSHVISSNAAGTGIHVPGTRTIHSSDHSRVVPPVDNLGDILSMRPTTTTLSNGKAVPVRSSGASNDVAALASSITTLPNGSVTPKPSNIAGSVFRTQSAGRSTPSSDPVLNSASGTIAPGVESTRVYLATTFLDGVIASSSSFENSVQGGKSSSGIYLQTPPSNPARTSAPSQVDSSAGFLGPSQTSLAQGTTPSRPVPPIFSKPGSTVRLSPNHDTSAGNVSGLVRSVSTDALRQPLHSYTIQLPTTSAKTASSMNNGTHLSAQSASTASPQTPRVVHLPTPSASDTIPIVTGSRLSHIVSDVPVATESFTSVVTWIGVPINTTGVARNMTILKTIIGSTTISKLPSSLVTGDLKSDPNIVYTTVTETGTFPIRTPVTATRSARISLATPGPDPHLQSPNSNEPMFPVPEVNNSGVAPTGGLPSEMLHSSAPVVTSMVAVHKQTHSGVVSLSEGRGETVPVPTNSYLARPFFGSGNSTKIRLPTTVKFETGVNSLPAPTEPIENSTAPTRGMFSSTGSLDQHGNNNGNNIHLPTTSRAGTPHPSGMNSSYYNISPTSTNGTRSFLHLPTPSNPESLRTGATTPTRHGIHLPTAGTGHIPGPTEIHGTPILLPEVPFPNSTVQGSPVTSRSSLGTAALTDSNGLMGTGAGTPSTSHLLPTGLSGPRPGASSPQVGGLSTLTTYTRTAVDDTVITVTNNAQALPTNGRTVTTFTAPNGTEKTITFLAETVQTRISLPTVTKSAAASSDGSRGVSSLTVKFGTASTPVDHSTATMPWKGSPVIKVHLPTPSVRTFLGFDSDHSSNSKSETVPLPSNRVTSTMVSSGLPINRFHIPTQSTKTSGRLDTDSIPSSSGTVPPRIGHVTSINPLSGSPASKVHLPTPLTLHSSQDFPNPLSTETESYDTTVYITITPTMSLASTPTPTPTLSSSGCPLYTNQMMEIDILWQIFNLLRENRAENLQNPGACSRTISHIPPDLLQKLRSGKINYYHQEGDLVFWAKLEGSTEVVPVFKETGHYVDWANSEICRGCKDSAFRKRDALACNKLCKKELKQLSVLGEDKLRLKTKAHWTSWIGKADFRVEPIITPSFVAGSDDSVHRY